MKIGAASVITRKSDIVFTSLDDELLAIDSQAGYCYSMNDIAGEVWEMLSEPTTLKALVSRLCDEFEVDGETCRREIGTLLDNFLEAGLIEVDSEQPPVL